MRLIITTTRAFVSPARMTSSGLTSHYDPRAVTSGGLFPGNLVEALIPRPPLPLHAPAVAV
jgi:hypothetical protein